MYVNFLLTVLAILVVIFSIWAYHQVQIKLPLRTIAPSIANRALEQGPPALNYSSAG